MQLFYRDLKLARMNFVEEPHTYAFLYSVITDANLAALLGLKQSAVDVILQQINDMVTQATTNYYI